MADILKYYLTGGAANSDHLASIGGTKSSVELTYQIPNYQASTPAEWPVITKCWGLIASHPSQLDNSNYTHYSLDKTDNEFTLEFDTGPGVGYAVASVDTSGTITGTVSVTAASANVVGVGTAFTTELAAGMYITIAGESTTVLSVTDNTNLVLSDNHAAGASGVALTAGIVGEYTITTPIYEGGHANGGISFIIDLVALAEADDWWSFYPTNPPTNMFSDVTIAQATTGLTTYRCIAFKNELAATVAVNIFLPDDVDAIYSIGLDPIGVGTAVVAATPATELVAPVGVTFTTPTSGAPLNVAALVTLEHGFIWIKRAVPVNNMSLGVPSVLNIIANPY